MAERAFCFNQAERFVSSSGGALAAADLDRFAEQWLLDNEYRNLSGKTTIARRFILGKLSWFLREKKCDSCGTPELRAFLGYVAKGHQDGAGRWGNSDVRGTRQVRPRTILTYYTDLRTFFRFLVAEGVLPESPMERIKPPANRPDQIRPFTPEQVNALLAEARRGPHPYRDEAILLFLLDTGARASEACGLRLRDLDLHGRNARVLGKGNKH